MKKLLLLIISMLSINQVNWQYQAITDWNIALANQGYSQWDNYCEPMIGYEIAKCHKWLVYVYEMDKILSKGKI